MKMNKIISFVLFAMTVLPVQAQKTKQIEILHTNDTHSCIMPLNPNLADTVVAGRGGYLRRVAMINQERKNNNPKLLLLDSGDFSQGSPYYSIFKGDVEIGLMNMMGYDAATIGNHEFDFGLENMARIFRMAKFPIVCSNYDFSGTPVEGTVKPYVVLRREGLKIGVLGVCPKLDGLVDSRNYGSVKYIDPVAVADSIADVLKNKEKCDLVICLSHLGWEDSPEEGDERLISNTRNIDIVLGGHSHTYFRDLRYVDNADGVPVPDDQNGKHAVYVGKILLTLAKK